MPTKTAASAPAQCVPLETREPTGAGQRCAAGECALPGQFAGVDKVFITQCKMWSYRNKWMYMDTKLEEVAQYTTRYPNRFVGLASYNPFRIKESLQELDQAIKVHGFKGVYIHIYGFDIPLHDAKMYPVYAKCVELDLPICVCVGVPGPRLPMAPQKVELIDEVCWFFPELKFVMRHGAEPCFNRKLAMLCR